MIIYFGRVQLKEQLDELDVTQAAWVWVSDRGARGVFLGCAAVRIVSASNQVFVAGTTAPGVDAEEQAREIFERIGAALEQAGASLSDVVRTRVFLVDIERDFDAVGAVHGEVFGEIRPACAFIGTAGLVAKDLLLEVEVDAVISA